MTDINEPTEGHVTIYSTSWCVWCDRAQRLFDEMGVPYRTVDIETWDAPRERLEAITGRRSVPQIFVGSTHVGGFDDLDALRSDGVLAELVSAERVGVST
jgi:glutaredoxin 3